MIISNSRISPGVFDYHSLESVYINDCQIFGLNLDITSITNCIFDNVILKNISYRDEVTSLYISGKITLYTDDLIKLIKLELQKDKLC